MITTVQPLSIPRIKKMVHDSNLISLATAIFHAMAWQQTVAAIVEPKQAAVIAAHGFKAVKDCAEATREIKTAREMYLASETDGEIFDKEMEAFYLAEGFIIPEPGFCPLLMAEHEVIKAQWPFVAALAEWTGIEHGDLWSNGDGVATYQKYIDLNLSLFASKVRH